MEEREFWKRVMHEMIARGVIPPEVAQLDPESRVFLNMFLDACIKRHSSGEDIRGLLRKFGIVCSVVDPARGSELWREAVAEFNLPANFLDAAPGNDM